MDRGDAPRRATEPLALAVRIRCNTTSLDPRVRPLAEGRIFRLLTATECHPFVLFEVGFHRREFPPHMEPIAKRLRFRSTALTPIDSAWTYFDNAGRPLRNHRLIRRQIPPCMHSLGVSGEVASDHRRSLLHPLWAFSTSGRWPLHTDRCQPQIVRNLLTDHVL